MNILYCINRGKKLDLAVDRIYEWAQKKNEIVRELEGVYPLDEERKASLIDARRDRAVLIEAADFLKNNRSEVLSKISGTPVFSLSFGINIRVHPGMSYYAVEIVMDNGKGGRKSFLSLPEGYGGCQFKGMEKRLDRDALSKCWEIPAGVNQI